MKIKSQNYGSKAEILKWEQNFLSQIFAIKVKVLRLKVKTHLKKVKILNSSNLGYNSQNFERI